MHIRHPIRTLAAVAAAAALGALALGPVPAAGAEIATMRHATAPLPGYGRLTLEIWNDGTTVQVIGLNDEGAIVLARAGTLTSEPTLEGTGAIEGVLPAAQLRTGADGAVESERCITARCARAIATLAEALVRAATMGSAQGPDAETIMTNLCPIPGASAEGTVAPTPDIATLAAHGPCKWQPVATAKLAPIPGVGRQIRVRIGDTVYALRQARWAIAPQRR